MEGKRMTFDHERYGPQFRGDQAGSDPLSGVLPWRAAPEALDWWRTARFGMFVHFGVAARRGVELSWGRDLPRPFDVQALVQHQGEDPQRIPHHVYDSLYRELNPQQFDARQWVAAAASAGAGYLVLTAKHHDGFCLWDTEQTNYKITAADCPFGRDVVAEVADACHRSGMRFGIYYSQRDWHHPRYLRDGNGEYQRYMDAQLRELLTSHGKVDVLWFDSYGESDLRTDWDVPGTINLVRQLQPDILINNRLAVLGRDNTGPVEWWGDFDTPEQRIGSFQASRPWESCLTLTGDQWGYRPRGQMLSLSECVHALVRTVVGDGNLLLNVGPDALGAIEDRQRIRLSEIGDWLATYGETIIGTRGYEVPEPGWGGASRASDAVYVHVLDWSAGPVRIPDDDRLNGSMEVLTGGRASSIVRDGHIVIDVAAADRDPIDTIIKLPWIG
jgi:alpha-L-fucosidase